MNAPPERPFETRRSTVAGLGPVVATGQPLAAQAGLQTMLAGGNAFDAAVAAAAMLCVVEPTGTGMGGDCFALGYVARDRRVVALNGSGRSPANMAASAFSSRGLARVPERGILSVTVPGAVAGWADLVRTLGRLPLGAALAPAIAAAERGYPVSELIADAWQSSAPLLARQAAAREHFLPGGRAPRRHEIVRLPALARSLSMVAEGGPDAFYRGPIADAIVGVSEAEGGYLTPADLATHASTWPEPLSVAFRGLRTWECPPNGQGLAALVALGVADGLDLPDDWGGAAWLHLLVESMRLGLAEARAWVADPEVAPAPLAAILSPAYLSSRRRLVCPDRAMDEPSSGVGAVPPANARGHPAGRGADTVYLATIDGEGNACSFIGSNYMGFGSGLVAGDTGIPLQNRGAGFVLDAGHPNVYAPGKRPYHTIIPALATRSDGTLAAVFGVMGGHMQPQGHLQVAANLWAADLGPQRALDAPRFQLLADGRLALEPWFGDDVRSGLASLGHRVVDRRDTPPAGSFGGGQVILVGPDGARLAGSDPRKDGQAVAAW